MAISDFMRLFRPKGYAKITDIFIGEDDVDVHEIPFTEIVCDFCNDLIEPKLKIEFHDEVVEIENWIYIAGTDGICEKCFRKYVESESDEKENKL